MTTVVVGVGSLGSLFAARLSKLTPVVMFGRWRSHLERIRRHGLHLLERDGRRLIFNPAAAGEPDALTLTDTSIERVLVLVKSYQTAAKAAQIGRFAPSGISILTLQNGLGNREILASALPEAVIWAGSTAQGALIVEPGVVRHTGSGLTHLPAGAEEWAHLFEGAGIPVSVSDDVDSIIWGKLIINAGINPLTAILNRPNGFLVTDDPSRRLMINAAEEAANVAAALGIELPYPDPAAAVLEVAGQTAANLSSMLQDVRRGVPTEIDPPSSRRR